MCLFCEKEDIERESIEKKEKLDNVLKIADKLIKQKNIKDVRESPVYSLIRAISNLHLQFCSVLSAGCHLYLPIFL